MGKTRKGLHAAGTAIAAASVLFFGQAGAAHAPMAFPAAPAVTAALAIDAAQTPEEPADRISARPLENVRIKVPALRLRLSPAETALPRLALGPVSYPDGALDLPGRTKPEKFNPQKAEVLEVGHSVSAPTGIGRADPFDRQHGNGRPETDAVPGVLAGLPLVSSAHAESGGSGGKPLGGPLTRMPIDGHILFENGRAILTEAAQAQLDRMVEALRAGHAALEVVAYAGERNSLSGEARRLALRRGLAVSTYLTSRGIDPARISVRPLGGVRDGGPKARVDVFHAAK